MSETVNASDKSVENGDIKPDKNGTEDSPGWTFPKESIIPNLILFPVVVVLAFGWCLLMLLIVSFVTLSYIRMKIKGMLIASAVFAAVVGVVYIIKTINKHKRK